jgi:hypothetical protein
LTITCSSWLSAEFAVPGAGFLQKPFSAAELGREVKALLDRG